MMKRLLQQLYDDYLFCKEQVVHEQIILGKRYVFVEFVERESQQQWQESLRNQEETSPFNV